jgi:uncharacterized protein
MSGTYWVLALALLGRITPLEDIRFTSVFEQRHDYSCGIAAISSLASIYWGFETDDASEDELINLLPGLKEAGRGRDITMNDLVVILESLGFTAGGFELTYDQLRDASSMYGPLIIHLSDEDGHFVLFLGETGDCVVLADPSRGCLMVSKDEFLMSWSHVALAVFHPTGKLDMNAVVGAIDAATARSLALRSWSRR